MKYQLPNGKIIYLSVEDYLSLSDEELHQLTHSGIGENPSYNFTNITQKKEEIPLDYEPDQEEPDTRGPIDLNNLANNLDS